MKKEKPAPKKNKNKALKLAKDAITMGLGFKRGK